MSRLLATRLSTAFHYVQNTAPFGFQSLHWLAVFFVVVGIGIVAWRYLPSNTPSQSITQTSIAVLPFVDMSEARDQDYFAEGVAEELRSALGQVQDLRVAGRTSSEAWKGKNTDIHTIGNHLNVATVLEGSIRSSRDHIRITIQLVDTSNGYQLWSETYDRQLQDIFTIQDEIARAVVQRLNSERRTKILDRPLATRETGNIEAYRLYLRGRYLWKRRYGDNLSRAVRLLQEAIARDADFARAHSALAAAYVVLPSYTKANRSDSFDSAERAARAALRLNPALSEPHAVLGWLYSERLDWGRAERQFRRAVAMEPVAPVTHLWYGLHSARAGRLQQALAQYEKALSLDPAWGLAVGEHSMALYALGQREAAIKGAQQAVALDYYYGHLVLRDIANEMGQIDKAIHHHIEYKRVRGVSEDRLRRRRQIYETNLGINGPPNAFLQETEHLLQSGGISSWVAFHRFYRAKQIDRAIELFDANAQPKFILWLRKFWWPNAHAFRTHPHFASLVANLKLIDYWREFGWPDYCGPEPTHGVQCQ